MKVSREKQVARVEHFASIWDRLLNLYLNREAFEDISAAKENEFLALQGSIMQELAAVAELEEGRFALVGEVTSVINESVSIRHLKDQSEFQIRRRKERGRQVAERIANLKSFIAERDSTAIRKEKEFEARRARPFWDPEKRKFAAILGRTLATPAHFFSGIRPTGQARKANSFLLSLLSLVSAGCFIIVTAFNSQVARGISYSFALESGILTSDVGAGSKIIIWLLVCVGVTIVSLAGAIAAAILVQVLAILMHAGFKIAGGAGDSAASHKVVAFGLAPVLLLLFLPVVAHFVQKGVLPSFLLAVLPAATLCYIAFLHVIGFSKVHTAPVTAGIAGWLIGAALFVVFVFASLFIWHASIERLPPSSGKYVYVSGKKVSMLRRNQSALTLHKGKILKFLGENESFYNVRCEKDEGRIKKSDVQLRKGSVWSLPGFLVESSLAQAESLIDKLSRKVRKEAKQSP